MPEMNADEIRGAIKALEKHVDTLSKFTGFQDGWYCDGVKDASNTAKDRVEELRAQLAALPPQPEMPEFEDARVAKGYQILC